MNNGYRPKGPATSADLVPPNFGTNIILNDESISDEFAQRLKEHENICNYLHDLYYRKNSDYGSSVTDTFNKYGLVSFLVRLEDKLNRARSLNQRGSAKVNDEKLEDTLMDMANYAMLAVIELRMNNK